MDAFYKNLTQQKNAQHNRSKVRIVVQIKKIDAQIKKHTKLITYYKQ